MYIILGLLMDPSNHFYNLLALLAIIILPNLLWYVWRSNSSGGKKGLKSCGESSKKQQGKIPEKKLTNSQRGDECCQDDIIEQFVANYSSPIKTPYIIGICGGSGSGKTFISNLIVAAVSKIYPHTCCNDIVVISQDSYYKGGNVNTNYDVPDAIDFELLIKHIKDLIDGRTIECPSYDFTTHSRKSDTTTITPKKIIIVEGILIFTQKELRDLFNYKLFIQADISTQIFRRTKRDMSERGRTLDEISERYLRDVSPSYTEYVLPSSRFADMSINNFNGCFVGPQSMLNHIITTMKNICSD